MKIKALFRKIICFRKGAIIKIMGKFKTKTTNDDAKNRKSDLKYYSLIVHGITVRRDDGTQNVIQPPAFLDNTHLDYRRPRSCGTTRSGTPTRQTASSARRHECDGGASTTFTRGFWFATTAPNHCFISAAVVGHG